MAYAQQLFNENEHFVLAMAPEGTRAKVDKWRTGFYHCAAAANVPIVGVGLDFDQKTLFIHKPFWPSGDIEASSVTWRSLAQTQSKSVLAVSGHSASIP